MLSIAEAVARAAESKIGVRESGGENKGPALQAFFDADAYDPNGAKPGDDGYAWCASFVCWCVLQAIQGRTITFNRPVTPGAWDFERWAREQDRSVMLLKPPLNDVLRGDIVVFKHSHVGIAVGGVTGGTVRTVEGNTNDSGGREGYMVARRTRRLTEIRSRIRFMETAKS